MVGLNAQRLWIVAVVALILVALALIGIIIGREVRAKKIEEDCLEESNPLFSEETVDKYFPGFFRDPEEKAFKDPALSENSNMSDILDQLCCKSTPKIEILPKFMIDISMRNRTVVQLGRMKQFIEVDTCVQEFNCFECRCFLQERLFTAVVLKVGIDKPQYRRDVEFDVFRKPMCCKCLRNPVTTT